MNAGIVTFSICTFFKINELPIKLYEVLVQYTGNPIRRQQAIIALQCPRQAKSAKLYRLYREQLKVPHIFVVL